MELVRGFVEGAEAEDGIGFRSANVTYVAYGEIPNCEQGELITMLESLGLPRKGDPLPTAVSEPRLTCRGRRATAVSPQVAVIVVRYLAQNMFSQEDDSTLSMMQSQIHPKDFRPLFIKHSAFASATNPNPRKIATASIYYPLRHYRASIEVPFQATPEIVKTFDKGCVNSKPWGSPKKPPGFWLWTGLRGMSETEGITYTYSVQMSTKGRENWSDLLFMEDPQGNALQVPEATVVQLRSKPYAYGMDNSVDGLLLCGFYEPVDFANILGLDPV